MSMADTRIAIIGGGLSGLYAAYALERQGIRGCVLWEARERLGGRLLDASRTATAGAAQPAPRSGLDLGATWFWPALQPQLDALIRHLDLDRFLQPGEGDMVFEHPRHAAPVRTGGFLQQPPSFRLVGGMDALVQALRERLRSTRIETASRVRGVHASAEDLAVEMDTPAGPRRVGGFQHVLLALPPRLAEAHLAFVPALPPDLARSWRATPTWMAAQAKYVAVYDTPFWRSAGLSGFAQSALGPLGEIHDASNADGPAALFGFLALPPRARLGLPDDQLRALCRAQLARLFGPSAARPDAEFLKDWARDPHTATAADVDTPALHAAPPAATAADGAWRGRLMGIASEWSEQFPGYVAGAVEAAHAAVSALAQAAGADLDSTA